MRGREYRRWVYVDEAAVKNKRDLDYRLTDGVSLYR
jgi:hypothetical protein